MLMKQQHVTSRMSDYRGWGGPAGEDGDAEEDEDEDDDEEDEDQDDDDQQDDDDNDSSSDASSSCSPHPQDDWTIRSEVAEAAVCQLESCLPARVLCSAHNLPDGRSSQLHRIPVRQVTGLQSSQMLSDSNLTTEEFGLSCIS